MKWLSFLALSLLLVGCISKEQLSVVDAGFCPTNKDIYGDCKGSNPKNYLETSSIYLRGGVTNKVAFSIPKNLTDKKLYYSVDGGASFSLTTDLQESKGNYSWSTPSIDSNSVLLKITGINGSQEFELLSKTLVVDSTPPVSTLVQLDSSASTKNSIAQFSSSDCSDTPYVLFRSTNVAPIESDLGWTSCSTFSSAMTYNLTNIDGTQSVYAFTKDLAGNISSSSSFSIFLDQTLPALTSVIINPSVANSAIGDDYTATVFVNVHIEFTEVYSNSSLYLKSADAGSGNCSTGTPVWESITGSGSVVLDRPFIVSSDDGLKKICVWVKDEVGNISAMASSGGTAGIDTDSISYETGNIPQITSFEVKNDGTSGYTAALNVVMNASWTITDVEGLDNNPLTMEYKLNTGTWLPLSTTTTEVITNYGGLTGNPTSYSASLLFLSPSSNYFQVRLKAKDKAGNNSIVSYSKPINTTPWEVYAGVNDTEIGSSSKTTRVTGNVNTNPSLFTVDPIKGDLYAMDSSGIVKFDIRKGLSSLFIPSGTLNLPASGVITPGTHVVSIYSVIDFTRDGKMIIMSSGSYLYAAKVWKLDISTMTIELMAGMGSDYTALTDSTDINFVHGAFAIDEVGAIYGFLNCSASLSWSIGVSALKLVKIAPDKTVTHIGGDCTKANAFSGGNGPYDPKTKSAGNIAYNSMVRLAVKDQGNTIMWAAYGENSIYKIVNGQLYKSALTTNSAAASLLFRSDGKLILSGPDIRIATVSSTDGNDTVDSTLLGMDWTKPNCNEDGVDLSQACGAVNSRPAFSKTGNLLFAEGPFINGPRPYRIRYVNDQGKMTTLAGTKPLYGEGLDKSNLRGKVTSISYQTAANANADFPEGLYFGSHEAVAFYYIDPTTGVLSRKMGSGIGAGGTSLNGLAVTSTSNLGTIYTNGFAGGLINFGPDGYPFIRIIQNCLYKVLAGMIGSERMCQATLWDNLANGASPSGGSIYVHGGVNNIPIKGDGVFLMGVGYGTSGNNSSSMRFMDFLQDKVIHIMGGNGTNAYTADVPADSNLTGLNLNVVYGNGLYQYMNYDPNTDRLYFIENFKKLRYITAPGTNSSKLITLIDFESTGMTFKNFTIRPDSTALFYVRENGAFFCYNLGGAPGSCDNSTSYAPISGLPSLASVIPNQFTWKDNNTMFASDGAIVLKFDVPF